jgi:hypothetical protein
MRCSRGALLTGTAAGLSLAVTAIWKRGGTGYVNLDSALQDVRVFWVFVVLPFAIALGCLLACLPRVVVVNIAATVGCFIALELAARLFVPTPPPVHGEPEVQGNAAFYVPDGTLGYTLARSATVRHRRTIGGAQIYDVTYRTDAAGRRETPARGGGGRESFLLFFGDSNVFGEGLSQTETLPYYTGEVAPGYRVYNYGVPGYGPSQALALADRGDLHGEIAEEEGYAVFFVIPAHVSRVVGSSRVSSSWGRHFPYYVETRHGGPVSAGDFTHGRPLTTLAYFFWAQSALADRLGIELPLWYTERDYRLTARVLREANRRLAEQYGSGAP